ncbi:hypothetical protein J3T92_02210 [Bifidobacterium sp. B4081]|uniref:hypothetical protein n=1 Tax=unclassified Bifidobacterium TaxID=2608897 RepID=UPI00226AFC66|nr:MULTISPECIES: hypothetical protein [unclassified Bifidobacterium]MCX8643244.1 hypothetical protein [Bifidobacterium sp. B4077]MCX8645426.1 hypothetical protein [Bifidobacterium sp. B4081]MCX8668863.1 hypothetical protein [Bifidobacterium sp. B3998]
MQHTLITPQSPGEQLAALAAGALDMASRQQTGAAGSATWHNNNGTRTVIGPDAGTSGIAPWVGDTTPPGMPTGIGVDSAAGMILVSWDGTLKGGIPADFDHVQILVDGVEAGQLRVRGTATLGPYEADSVHRVTVRAWDDAHAEDGSPAPNGSEPTKPVSVTVKSVVDADEIKDAQDKAQEAINQIAGVSKDVQQASKDAQTAASAATSASGKADTASSKADAATAAASAASAKADGAAASASTASNKADAAASVASAASGKADRALSNGAELVRNPGMDPALGDLDGFGIGMDTGDAPSAPPQPYSHYAAIKQRDYFSSWRFPLAKNRVYRFGAWVVADKADRKDLRIGWRYTNPGTHWDECFTVHAKDALQWTWVSGYAKTPDAWDDKPNSLVMWLNVNGYYSDAQGWWLTGLTVKDVTEAQGAQLTADGKNRTYTSQTEPAHAGLTQGDVWYRQDSTGNVVGVMVWDGSKFNRQTLVADQLLVPGSLGPISMADGSVTASKIYADEAMLKKLLVRKLLADEIDVGSLAAAIIQSDRFVTKDGLNGLDESGFWTKDKDGNILFKTSDGLVQAVGGWQTASKGDRIQLSQTLIQGTNTGGLQGIGDDPTHPYWLIWGDHNGASSRLLMGTSPQQPQFSATIGPQGSTAGVAANRVDIAGSESASISGDITVNAMPRYGVGRRVYQWVSAWSGVPVDGWVTEVASDTFVVPGPGEGRWYMCDVGARVAGNGEYGLRVDLVTPEGRIAVRHALLSPPKNGGIDNFSSSRMVFMKAGTYVVRIQTIKFGDVSIDSNGDWAFADPYANPHVFSRYAFLTEC